MKLRGRLSRRTGMLVTRWMVLPVLVLAGGLLVASNVVLQSGAARGWFERKLERRSGLDWEIRYLSWTPWSGMQAGGVTASFDHDFGQDAPPLYAVEEMDVAVHWRELRRGRLVVRELRMRGVQVAVPFEVAGLLAPPEPAAGNPPEREETEPGTAPSATDAEPDRTGQGAKQTTRREGGRAARREAGQEVEDASETTEHDETPASPPAGLPVDLVVEDGEMVFYSLAGGREQALTIGGLRAQVPMGGEDRPGWVEIGGVTLGDEQLTGPLRAPVQWVRPFLVMPARSFRFAGLELEVAASLRTRGAPLCNAEVRLVPGALDPTPVPGWPELSVSAAHAELQARFRGNLEAVQSWRGDAVVELTNIQLCADGRSEEVAFDLGRVTAILQGTVVQVADARLVSERLSFLGNAVALPDGRVLGIARIVADREYAEVLTKVASGSFLSGGWTRSWLDPLQTPDRYYRDLHLRGTLRDGTIDVGKDGEEIPMRLAWRQLAAFLKQEAAETEAGEAPSPPREKIFIPESP